MRYLAGFRVNRETLLMDEVGHTVFRTGQDSFGVTHWQFQKWNAGECREHRTAREGNQHAVGADIANAAGGDIENV